MDNYTGDIMYRITLHYQITILCNFKKVEYFYKIAQSLGIFLELYLNTRMFEIEVG